MTTTRATCPRCTVRRKFLLRGGEWRCVACDYSLTAQIARDLAFAAAVDAGLAKIDRASRSAKTTAPEFPQGPLTD